jgi:drug/metabolite transporter (DMT)-like permease
MQFEHGDLFMLLMAIAFSISQIIVAKYLAHIQATLMTTISSIMALGLFLIFSIEELITMPIPTEFDFWISVLYMGILATGIAYTAFYYSVINLGATISTLYLNLIPFFAVLMAFPFGEEIHTAQLTGGMIIIFGIVLFSKANNLNKQLN